MPFRACWLSLARPCLFSENRINRSLFLVDHSAWIVHKEEEVVVLVAENRRELFPADGRDSFHPVQDCRCLARFLVETASLNSLHRRVKTGFRIPLPEGGGADLVRTSTPRSDEPQGRPGERAGFRNVVVPDVLRDECLEASGQDDRCNPAVLSSRRTANRKELAVERAAKKEAVETLNGVFKTTGVAVVAHYSGLTVAQMQTLRTQMKQAGASVKVSKNRLAKIALEGTDVVSIGSLLKGPTVIATSSDPIAAPKVAIEFAKTNEKFVILGGAMGTTVLNPDAVKALASLPSLDELRAKIVGLLVAPATKIAQLSTAPAAKLARVVQAYASKGEAA